MDMAANSTIFGRSRAEHTQRPAMFRHLDLHKRWVGHIRCVNRSICTGGFVRNLLFALGLGNLRMETRKSALNMLVRMG